MRLICRLTFIFAALCMAQASAKDLDSHLVAHYKFDGDFSDRSENQFHGENRGVTFCSDRFNEKDAAASFDGINNFIRIPVNINPRNYPQLTICAWVRLSDVEQKGVLISHDNGGFDRTLILDARGDNNGDFEWSAFCGTGEVLGSKEAYRDRWFFVAVSYDQEKEKIILSIDNSRYYKEGKLSAGLPFCRIGSNPGFGEFLKGDVDDLRIYSKVLSSKELKLLQKQ